MRYTAYQLRIESEFELPELHTDAEAPDGTADITFRRAEVSLDQLSDDHKIAPLVWAEPGTLWINVPGVARFRVQGGREILVDPAPSIDAASVRVFLLGSAMGALLMQRGLLVLHGNAVRVGNHCVICIGSSGAGKSAVAAGLWHRGHHVIADDVVALDDSLHVLPGLPRIKLWRDVADALNVDVDGLSRVRPGLEKFHLPLERERADGALPVKAIYLLEIGNNDQVTVEHLKGMQRYLPLHDHAYRVRFLEGMGLQEKHLRRCGQLVRDIHLARIHRPRRGLHLDAVLDCILNDLSALPVSGGGNG